MFINNNKNTLQKVNCNQDYKTFIIDPVDIVFGKLVILENTKMVVKYGEHYGLVGKNGIGKTALLNAIANRDLLVPQALDIIYVKQEEPESKHSVLDILLSAKDKLYQANNRLIELESLMNSDAEINDELINEHEMLSREYGSEFIKEKIKVQKILLGLGFSKDDQLRSVSEFSGGWRMRISLAKALFMTPTMLILDEPTNHLDLHANIWLVKYLKNYPKTVFVVSHDKYFIDEVCTTIININKKKLNYYCGNYEQFQKQLKQDNDKIKKNWLLHEKKIISMRKSKKSRKDIDEYIQNSTAIKPERDYIVKINFLQPSIIKGNFAELSNITFGYTDTNIFENLNIKINIDSRMAIVGKNGVGKSTILKLLVGELIPISGKVITSSALKIGYYNQHFEESMDFNINGVQYLMSLNNDINLTLAHKYLSSFGLEPIHHNVKIGALSGGQKARVKLASFGVIKPHLLVLDEPTNHLDIVAIESLINALNNFKGAIVLVTHNFDIITKLNLELWIVDDGKIEKYSKNYDDYVQNIYDECLDE